MADPSFTIKTSRSMEGPIAAPSTSEESGKFGNHSFLRIRIPQYPPGFPNSYSHPFNTSESSQPDNSLKAWKRTLPCERSRCVPSPHSPARVITRTFCRNSPRSFPRSLPMRYLPTEPFSTSSTSCQAPRYLIYLTITSIPHRARNSNAKWRTCSVAASSAKATVLARSPLS